MATERLNYEKSNDRPALQTLSTRRILSRNDMREHAGQSKIYRMGACSRSLYTK